MIPTGGAGSRWRAAPREALLWAEFDGEFVLFHRPSGQTHFLNAASACLLLDILVEPTDLDAACAALDAAQAPEADDSADRPEPVSWSEPARRDYLRGLLERFEELGLVARSAG